MAGCESSGGRGLLIPYAAAAAWTWQTSRMSALSRASVVSLMHPTHRRKSWRQARKPPNETTWQLTAEMLQQWHGDDPGDGRVAVRLEQRRAAEQKPSSAETGRLGANQGRHWSELGPVAAFRSRCSRVGTTEPYQHLRLACADTEFGACEKLEV